MAYPTLHLLVAAQATSGTALAEEDAYLLGAIAPDAIHMRHGTCTSLGKRETHLLARGDGVAESEAYLAAHGRAPFHLGYAVHVRTDRLWVRFFKEAYPALILPDGHVDPAAYQPDADWIDRALAAEVLPRTSILFRLARAVPPEDHPLLSAAEIGGWRDRYVALYSAIQAMPPGAPVHMRLARVQAFMAEAARTLRQMLV